MKNPRHLGLAQAVHTNMDQGGHALLLSTSNDEIGFVGTVDSADMLDFLETMFRASPGLKAVFAEAMERSECPLS